MVATKLELLAKLIKKKKSPLITHMIKRGIFMSSKHKVAKH